MVEVYVYTSDYARTGDYNILKICAHIGSSDLQHRVFIWNFNYCQKKKTFSRVPESTSRDWKNWSELKIFVEQFLKEWQKKWQKYLLCKSIDWFLYKGNTGT